VALHAALSRRVEPGRIWYLSGDDDARTRAQVIDWYKRSEGGACLICTPFFREGVDLPQVDNGFLAGGGESDIAVWQGVCRLFTVREGKTEATVHDFVDGREQTHLKDYLANHYKSRRELYRRHGCEIIEA
jgi:superfamily II DNA or RNA helicase